MSSDVYWQTGPWRQAASLPAAGELTARWLKCGSEYQPGTLTPWFDDETLAIAPLLAELNRNCLFNKESQPGLLEQSLAERAYVTGSWAVERRRSSCCPSRPN